MSTAKSPEDTAPSREEVYQALVRSLRRRKGFGIVFVQCSPAEATQLIQRVQQDLPQKRVAVLQLTEPIDNLYDLVANRPERNELNILFIQGLEKSLEPYIKPGYGGEGNYYNLDTVPPILSHLNQRRENFRDRFPNICFVFFLPPFAIKYFILRAPDFFDWSSGVFEFSSDSALFALKRVFKAKTLKALSDAFLSLIRGERASNLERAIAYYKDLLENQLTIGDRLGVANTLKALGDAFLSRIRGERASNYEQAIAYYEKALAIYREIADFYGEANTLKAFGDALQVLKQYEKALDYYDAALAIYQSADLRESCYKVWLSRGIALKNLGQYQKALSSFDAALKSKPDDAASLYNKAGCYAQLGNAELALENLQRAIELNPEKYIKMANNDSAFDIIRDTARFQSLFSSDE
jgi:tetratricopeptide (TPR) repeat protein